MNKANYKALLPIGVFLVLYLGLGIIFEYVMKIPMGFYNVPIISKASTDLQGGSVSDLTLQPLLLMPPVYTQFPRLKNHTQGSATAGNLGVSLPRRHSSSFSWQAGSLKQAPH